MSGIPPRPYDAYNDRPSVEQQYASGALEKPEGGDLPSEQFTRVFAEQKRRRRHMRQYLIYGGIALVLVAVVLALQYAAGRFRTQ